MRRGLVLFVVLMLLALAGGLGLPVSRPSGTVEEPEAMQVAIGEAVLIASAAPAEPVPSDATLEGDRHRYLEGVERASRSAVRPAPPKPKASPPTSKPTAPAPPRPPKPNRPPATGDVWGALAACESGGNPGAHGGGGRYHGAFQFALATWRSLGYGGDPHEHSYEVQLEAAKRLQARSGWGQWPRCARRLGLL